MGSTSTTSSSTLFNDILKEIKIKRNDSITGVFSSDGLPQLQDKRFCVIIGAGITGQIVGQWNELLNSLVTEKCLYEAAIDGGSLDKAKLERHLNGLKKKKSSFLPDSTDVREKGEYLRYSSLEQIADSISSTNQEADEVRERIFARRVQQTILRLTKEKTKQANVAKQIEALCNSVKTSYSTLYATLYLCLKCNPVGIITYNFDTIFDRLLASPDFRNTIKGIYNDKYVQIYNYHSVNPVNLQKLLTGELLSTDTSSTKSETIDIYHVHGILDATITDPEPIIFSGTSYDSYQGNNLNRSTRTITNIIDQCEDVLCVGFSGEDTNFRQIIENYNKLYNNPIFHCHPKNVYLLTALEPVAKNYGYNDKIDSDTTNIIRRLLLSFIQMKNDYYARKFGINIVWSESFDTMANDIKKIADTCK